VIATLPQLTHFDGNEVTRTERIKAMQRLPELQAQLRALVPLAVQRKAELKARFAEKQRKIESGEIIVNNETTDEWCPEVRVSDARELREIEEQKEASRKKAQDRSNDLFSGQRPRERRFFKDDGTPVQMNTGKWPFSIDDDGVSITVDVALPKFLDSAQIDADVQPTYVRITAKKQTLQLVLPDEVLTDSSVAKRSATTGHLLLTCPKIHPVVVSKAPQPKRAQPKALGQSGGTAGLLPAPPAAPGSSLKGAVDIRSIVATPGGGGGGGAPPEALKPVLGPDFDEEEEVPPLL